MHKSVRDPAYFVNPKVVACPLFSIQEFIQINSMSENIYSSQFYPPLPSGSLYIPYIVPSNPKIQII